MSVVQLTWSRGWYFNTNNLL